MGSTMIDGTMAAWHASQKVAPIASGYSVRFWGVFEKPRATEREEMVF